MASNPSEKLSKRWPDNKVTTFTVKHDWTVGPFPGLPEQSATGKSNWKEITSPKFAVVEGGHNLQFQMALQFVRVCNDQEWVNFTLYCYSGKEVASEVPVSFELAFDDPGDSRFSYTRSHNFTSDGFPFLTIFTDFTFGDRTTLHQIKQLKVSVKLSGAYIKATSFFLSQMELLESGTLSDFTVVIGKGDKKDQQQQIPVHKALLAARSPVFAAMFRHKDTKEAQENQVVISDVHGEVFKDLLQYLYTGVKPKCGRLTIELLILADKYQVKELREHCEQYLSTSLSVNTVVSDLQVAHLHSAAVLKESCLKFMASHFAKVVNTLDWEELCQSGNSSQLMLEATRAIAKYMQAEAKAEKKK